MTNISVNKKLANLVRLDCVTLGDTFKFRGDIYMRIVNGYYFKPHSSGIWAIKLYGDNDKEEPQLFCLNGKEMVELVDCDITFTEK